MITVHNTAELDQAIESGARRVRIAGTAAIHKGGSVMAIGNGAEVSTILFRIGGSLVWDAA